MPLGSSPSLCEIVNFSFEKFTTLLCAKIFGVLRRRRQRNFMGKLSTPEDICSNAAQVFTSFYSGQLLALYPPIFIVLKSPLISF